MHAVNQRGYVTDRALGDRIMIQIMNHLVMFGKGEKLLGNCELTYTMWYNFIFVNLYSLLLDKIL